MGDHSVKAIRTNEHQALFIRNLLDDVQALDIMLKQDLFETGITRIGAEQEFCLVNEDWRPASIAEEMLQLLDDPHYTTEIALYNLEVNLDPLVLEGKSFSEMHQNLKAFLEKAEKAAQQRRKHVLLSGILPTITQEQLGMEHMTPNPRYYELNERIRSMRGKDFEFYLRGVDELSIKHDSVLFEGCNTSFQLHLQIEPSDFVASYNWSQAISAPILSVCTNSPLLLGRELWQETRIGLFQQSVDTRRATYTLNEQDARVTFGTDWLWESVSELFKDNIARYPILLTKELEHNSLSALHAGQIPQLIALRLHNGTVYRWNRPCYGISNGKAHLRIENRYVPAGPSMVDEIANFAFWIGVMAGRPAKYDRVNELMDFRDAKSNFLKAARNGKDTYFYWMGKPVSARQLILDELLPMAYEGLRKHQIDEEDISRYMGVIEARLDNMDGAQWQIKAYRTLAKSSDKERSLLRLTQSMYENQQFDLPVSSWKVPVSEKSINLDEKISLRMRKELFTVQEKDPAALVLQIMKWKNIPCVPVLNHYDELVGILTEKHSQQQYGPEDALCKTPVSAIMEREPFTVPHQSPVIRVKSMMEEKSISYIPVLKEGKVMGIALAEDLED